MSPKILAELDESKLICLISNTRPHVEFGSSVESGDSKLKYKQQPNLFHSLWQIDQPVRKIIGILFSEQ